LVDRSKPKSVVAGGIAAVVIAAAVGLSVCRRLEAVPRTLRVDYLHSGNSSSEHFAVERFVVEPTDWPGHPRAAIDDTDLGKYAFKVIDRSSGRVVHSRGFASIYGEWETTGEAKDQERSFSESVRFPAPAAAVDVVIEKRDAQNAFREVWRFGFDPKNAPVERSAALSPGPVIEIEKHGPSADKVDFLILGDGYTAAERGKFEKDARRLVDILFSKSPFREHRTDFNVWGLCPAAAESGISRPSTGIERRSPVGATYDAFGSERYILTFENKSMRDIAAFAPYEFVEILANGNTYGGGGIFNLYSTVAADSLWSPYLFIHEFGHHFAGLADEYYTSDVAFEQATERVEPWEPNATALRHPDELKWRELVQTGTPVPTPWAKEAIETQSRAFQKKRKQIRADRRPESEMDALFLEQKTGESKLLSADAHAAQVGAFEGALYEAQGYYRPQEDCVMFSRNDVPFCAVCRRAIERIIDFYTGRRPWDAPEGGSAQTKSP
jgi:hypothetical protein